LNSFLKGNGSPGIGEQGHAVLHLMPADDSGECRMNVIEKKPKGGQPSNLDLDRFRLRNYLESLAGTD
jgi:hypothetical protein